MTSMEDLRPLVDEPMERLDCEYKGWLNLDENHGKAVLVKAAIALANHGGGYIVIGMPEDENKNPQSEPRPADCPTVTQDAVNNAISRYAEPAFQCGVRFVPHHDTGTEHPVVIVPGMLTVPVMSTSSQSPLRQHVCYIRKIGPKSEEPHTAEEWRALLNRCVRANRDEMLDAIRTIMTGQVEIQTLIPSVLDELQDYCDATRSRWTELVSVLPHGHKSRFPHGYWEIGLSLVGAIPAESLSELRSRMNTASRISFTGWPLFLALDRQELGLYPADNCIEAWVGRPVPNRVLDHPEHSDFWRATPEGKLYSIRGYMEDGGVSRWIPGQVFHATIPVWRLGEALLFATRLAETFEEVDQIAIHCQFTGLSGRRLHFKNDQHFAAAVCHADSVKLNTLAALQQVRDNLAEVVHSLLIPLYERFDFYQLPLQLVQRELHEMQSRTF